MPKGLPHNVRDCITKVRTCAIAAVEAYNRPGPRFRTAQYVILIVMAWTALFHAIFYRRRKKPWYRRRGVKAVRYQKIDGEPKHWDLAECLKQYYKDKNPPERQNLDFLLGLRNKIEHRHLPILDPSLYGECQAALLNLEAMLVDKFGDRYALEDQLAVSLQFSKEQPDAKKKVAKALASGAAKSVTEYVERFRGKLPSTVLSSMKYSFNVFLVPKLANRQSAADHSVEFINVDEASDDELERLKKLNVLIKEKRIPISNLDLYKPSQVIDQLQPKVPFRVTMNAHTMAWKHFKVRPKHGARKPHATNKDFCVYDAPHGDYLYTSAWINKLVHMFSDAKEYKAVTGRTPSLIEARL